MTYFIQSTIFNVLHSVYFIHSTSPLPIQAPRYKASLSNAEAVDALNFKLLESQLSEIKRCCVPLKLWLLHSSFSHSSFTHYIQTYLYSFPFWNHVPPLVSLLSSRFFGGMLRLR